MTGQPPIVAVLTGDLIDSSDVGAAATKHAIQIIEETARSLAGWSPNDPRHFARFRGDGWQILLENHALALRCSIMIMARLMAEKRLPGTRIAIGLGHAGATPGTADISAAFGTAFEASGHMLDAMQKHDRLKIDGLGIGPLHRAIAALVEDHIRRWTPEQAEATAQYLHLSDPTLKDIAHVLGISPQAVHSRLTGAGAQTLRDVVRLWESHEENRQC